MAVTGDNKFAAYMVRDVSPKKDALIKPNGFEEVYNSRNSKYNYGVSIWRPTCPDNYVALGFVAIKDYYMPMPDGTNFRCVSTSIVTPGGKWNWVWYDTNSGAKMDGQIVRADPTSIRGDSVGVWAMSAIANYGDGMSKVQPNFLKAAKVSLRFQKPIRSVTIKNLVYDINNMHIISQGPSDITRGGGRTIVSNCGE